MAPARALDEPIAIETEILQERVATLARISNTLAAHVEDARPASDALASVGPDDRPELVRQCGRFTSLVRTWYWYLIVQREANGLRHHQGLDEHFGISHLVGSR